MNRNACGKSASFIAVCSMATGCGSPPKPKTAPIEEASIDQVPASTPPAPTATSAVGGHVPHDLAGGTLDAPLKDLKGVHATHPPGAAIPGRSFSWYAPKKLQKLEDVTPNDTSFGIASDKLAAIVLNFRGDDACTTLRDALPSRYGSPTSQTTPKGLTFYQWQDGSAQLRFDADFSGKRAEDHSCSVTLQDVQSVVTAQNDDPGPTMGHSVDHFGSAKLGAPRSSFKGLVFREKNSEGEWWEPAAKTYHGIALSRLTYKFQNDALVNVSFSVTNFGDCPKFVASLKSEYGTADDTSASDGEAYEWTGPAAKVKYSSSNIMKSCGGIVYGGDSSLGGAPGASSKSGKSGTFDTTHDANSGFKADTGSDHFGTSSNDRFHVSQ